MIRGLRQLFLMIALLPACLMAQEEETADFTSDLFGGITGVDVLPKGRLQWETFAFYEHTTMKGNHADSWSPNVSMLRYGINSNTELCLQGALLHTTDEGANYTGISDLAVGFKTRLFDGWKAVPAISMRGLLYFPLGENYSFLPDDFGFRLDLIFFNHLTSWCDLGYMGSVIWDDTPHPTIVWGAYLDFLLSDRWTLSVEESNYYYGPDEEEKLQPWVSATLSYQVHPRVGLGITSDVSLRHSSRFYNVMVGVAWQLTKK